MKCTKTLTMTDLAKDTMTLRSEGPTVRGSCPLTPELVTDDGNTIHNILIRPDSRITTGTETVRLGQTSNRKHAGGRTHLSKSTACLAENNKGGGQKG